MAVAADVKRGEIQVTIVERYPWWEPLWVALLMSLRGLSTNRLRAGLTVLGVVIGVGAVIVAVGIGQGSREAVAASIQRLGTNVLTVFPGSQRQGQISFGFGSTNTLKLEDAAAIVKQTTAVGKVYAQVNRTAQVKFGDKNTNTQINGVGPDYPTISNHPIQRGQFFVESDMKSLHRVALLGSSVAVTLFDRRNPVGNSIRISGQSYRVIGVLAQKGGQGMRNPDDAVYVPTTTAMRRLFGMENVNTIVCQSKSFATMARAQTEIENLLRKRHNLSDNAASDFIIFNQADLAATRNEQQDTFTALITWLAVVSLAVGGIGIMNIMLVSVTERTREIGLRKALGARRNDVLFQFLFEALLLSVIGGMLGVALGVGGSRLVATMNNWQVALEPSAIVLAFGVSAAVGVFFGFYPALKASKLHPVEALRFE